MFWLKKQDPLEGPRVTIEPLGEIVQTWANETILKAALRNDVLLPNSCRIGGCGTCKLKVVSGQIRHLIDVSYILTDEEIAEGYAIICQAVPQTDVTVEVEF